MVGSKDLVAIRMSFQFLVRGSMRDLMFMVESIHWAPELDVQESWDT